MSAIPGKTTPTDAGGQTFARHWINGESVKSPKVGRSISPATGEFIGSFADGGAVECQAGIDAARVAFDDESWTNDYLRRSKAISHLADSYEARADEMVMMLCREIGKIPYEARFEFSLLLRGLRFAAGLVTQNFGRVLDPRPGSQAMCIRQPVGVAGLIIPWNGPAYLFVRALAPALAAGCTAVVKMPDQAAQIAAIHADIIASVKDIPKSAANIFTEFGIGRREASRRFTAGANRELHRQHAHRTDHRSVRRQEPQACPARTRRQDSASRL